MRIVSFSWMIAWAAVVAAYLGIGCRQVAAQAVVFSTGFEYSGGEPTPQEITFDIANLNGADGQVGAFSGILPDAAGGEFEPDLMGFADHPGPNQMSRVLWVDRPVEDGSFFADLATVIPLDGATVSFEVGTRRTNGNNHNKDYDIIGRDSGGNESFHLRISGAADIAGESERVGLVTDAGSTLMWDLPTVTGMDADQDLDNLSGTFDPGEIGLVTLNLASDGFILDFENFLPGGPNAYTTDTLSYNGPATELSQIEFTFAGGGANGQRSGYVLDNLLVTGVLEGGLYSWGERIAVGSWGDPGGWRVSQNGGPFMDATDIPVRGTGLDPSDLVRVVSGTVNVDADHGGLSLQVDSGAGVNVQSSHTLSIVDEVNTDAGSTLSIAGTLEAGSINSQGSLTFSDGTLQVGGGTIVTAAAGSNATIQNSAELSIGQMTGVGNGDALTKQSGGALILTQSSGPNDFAAGATINVEGGTLAGVNTDASSSWGSADVIVGGGDLVLSSSGPGAAAFDVAVAMNSTNVIRAAQVTGAVADETVILGGTNGVTVAADTVTTIETANGYTLNLAGAIGGEGQLSFADGARVNINAAVTNPVVEFQGNTDGITGTGNVAPGQEFRFAPTAETTEMTVDFNVGGDVDVIVEGQLNDGSVELTGGSNYTGTTIIRRGTFVESVGPDLPDYNNDGTVNAADYTVWRDGNSPDSSQAGYDLWKQNFGATAASSAGGLPANSLLQFEAADAGTLAVLETAQATFTRNIGTGAGEVNWAGHGGFASRGNPDGTGLTVTLNGGAEINWLADINNGDAMADNDIQLGSPFADGKTEFANPINLSNAEQDVQIADNPNSADDFVVLSGVITGGGPDGELTISDARGGGTFDLGLAVLTASNDFAKLRIEDASVDAVDGVGLPSAANLEFDGNSDNRPAVWVGNGTFNRDIGQGNGQVFWERRGGFAARGGPLTVTLENGNTLSWRDPDTGFDGNRLQLGSNQGDDVVTFTNDVTGFDDVGENVNRTIETFDNANSDADKVVIEGNFTEGFNNLIVEGSATVDFNGDATTGNNFIVRNDDVTMFLNGTLNTGNNLVVDDSVTMFLNGNVNVNNDLNVNDSATVFVESTTVIGDNLNASDMSNTFINGSVMLDDLNTNNSAGFGGAGIITALNFDSEVRVEANNFLRPGANLEDVGTLTVELEFGADMEIHQSGTYEMEFENDGGVLQHDAVVINSDSTIGALELEADTANGEVWNLQLSALGDLTGLISAGDEFNLFTWNEFTDLVVADVNIGVEFGPGPGTLDNVALISTDFDVSAASVQYVIESDFSGRLFVTGLALQAAGTSAVPEPASSALALLLATIGVLICPSRMRDSSLSISAARPCSRLHLDRPHLI